MARLLRITVFRFGSVPKRATMRSPVCSSRLQFTSVCGPARMRASASGALVTALLLVSVPSGAAAHRRVAVPPGCGTEEQFREGLRHLIGDAAETVSGRVEIAPDHGDGTFALRLSIGDETRTLRDPSCQTLFRSAIVMAAA